jgi:L-lactate utilization protein LutC
MSARERILQRVHSVSSDREASLPTHVQPIVDGDLVGRFTAALEAAAGTWERLAQLSNVPERVSAYCALHGLSGELAVAPQLNGLDWPGSLPASLEARPGSTDGQAHVAVSQARAGVAETGSLVLASGPQTPTRLNFLSDHQLVVLESKSILSHLEDALTGEMPRALNLVTGPSRTADVEQTLQLGAHGPRRLHVLLVG